MTDRFKAIVLDQADGKTTARLAELAESDLMPGNVTVDVAWSTLNYKDALATTGSAPIVRSFPFVPGIDFAGTVRSSGDERYRPGDEVVLTGWGVGERHFGGLAQRARVSADWLVPMPDGLTSRTAMTIGTAGFTAALCVLELERQGVTPHSGEVVVTGAAGGVGSVAVAMLAAAGFRVVASTGKTTEADWLHGLGAADVIDRRLFLTPGKGPLDKARFAGAVDTVGGATLAGLLRTMSAGSTVTAVGNAGGAELSTTVFPFILRGVRLCGVDSVQVPFEPRQQAWRRLARDLGPDSLAAITSTIGLADVPAAAAGFLQGAVKGRIVVDTQG
ncbi:MAG TPA: MDR family oxidoreductase [Geminicoccus sp.]|jgi:acrylyl-CoA reductase (NADPH)|uniref:MDR family oxidoreductase n=1 Tax=Geminicoccus sp. TaxID=2024832 RepID=UPI002E30FB8B|nr:MDR family oxidoreductase [Geminicoccus sp.]HEX2527783.1 MDR family oxidoreductase [Geminicoccus sp.]